MTADAWLPDAGDLVGADLTPPNAKHQSARRPAFVISSRTFTAVTGPAVACPMILRIRPFPTSAVLPPGQAKS
jgi:mRNA interferase MazF